MTDIVVRLQPSEYVHIVDNNTSAATLVVGPVTLTLQSNQSLALKKTSFHEIHPRNYSVIEHPVARDESGNLIVSKYGQAKNRTGERKVLFAQDPFPLYPGEVLIVNNVPQPLLKPTEALRLRALVDFKDEREKTRQRPGDTQTARKAGEEYLWFGPSTYTPIVEEEVLETRQAIVLKHNVSLKLRANVKFVDVTGTTRDVGDDYLWSKPGAYILGIHEKLLAEVPARILPKDKALHIGVKKEFVDHRPWAKGVKRQPGDVYLVDASMTSEFTTEPYETIVKEVGLTTVTSRQFAVILDPCGDDGRPQLGRRKVVTKQQFFLRPGETLEENAIRDVYVLGNDEALLLHAIEEFDEVTPDGSGTVKRISGEQWLRMGPGEYIPHDSVRVKKTGDSETRRRIPLGLGEGVYVRDTITGDVRAVVGESYMLGAYEELWEKQLPAVVEEKLAQQLGAHSSYMDRLSGGNSQTRDKTRLVQYHIPHNAVTQVFDYKKRTRRTIFGPNLVSLGPDEEFTVMSLSGSDWDPKRPSICLPKQSGKIKALYLFLGPSAMSDVVNVETCDHARLSLQLSYDWRFDVAPGNEDQGSRCFNVPDFVGDCCSCIASRVRASIAGISFEEFHKNSAKLLQQAVFGKKQELTFPSNGLVVTSVDIQSIDVTDEKTREALQQSVKMAIEITTQAQEAVARQEASVREQTAKGKLERQQIQDKSLCEVERKKLIEAQTECSAISSTGQAKAEAKARAKAASIEGDLSVQLAEIKAKRSGVMDEAQLKVERQKQEQELNFLSKKDLLIIGHAEKMAELESSKFSSVMESIGPETVQEIARAGPEMQAKLLGALGLQGYLVTDGTNPINLFNTANGMTAAAGATK